MIQEHITMFEGKMVEKVLDNGDGTGIKEKYDIFGNVIETIELNNLPLPYVESPESEPEEIPLTTEAALRMREAFDAIATGSLTVTKLKQAMQAAIDAIGEQNE